MELVCCVVYIPAFTGSNRGTCRNNLPKVITWVISLISCSVSQLYTSTSETSTLIDMYLLCLFRLMCYRLLCVNWFYKWLVFCGWCCAECWSVYRILSEFLQRIPMFDERKNQKDLQVEIALFKLENWCIILILTSLHVLMYLVLIVHGVTVLFVFFYELLATKGLRKNVHCVLVKSKPLYTVS